MESFMAMRALFSLVIAIATLSTVAAQNAPAEDAVRALVTRLEQSSGTGNRAATLAMGLAGESTPGLVEFAALSNPIATRFIIKERDRSVIREGSERLLLEVFIQRDNEARISTWRLDVSRASDAGAAWAIAELERLSVVSGLYRLELNPTKQFDIRNLVVRGPDLTLEIPKGTAFVAEIPDGPTAVVLLGRGRMRFSPDDPAEQTQLRIFAGDPIFETDFDSAFVRIRPGDLESRFGRGSLVPRAVSRRDFGRAEEIFDEYVRETLHLDLTDLSRERWSLTPSAGDLIAEIRTRGHGSLTYARVGKDAEDISLFDRRRRRNISVYASDEKRAARGRFYNEDDLVEYDVIDTEIES
jgi:hypothetical protein